MGCQRIFVNVIDESGQGMFNVFMKSTNPPWILHYYYSSECDWTFDWAFFYKVCIGSIEQDNISAAGERSTLTLVPPPPLCVSGAGACLQSVRGAAGEGADHPEAVGAPACGEEVSGTLHSHGKGTSVGLSVGLSVTGLQLPNLRMITSPPSYTPCWWWGGRRPEDLAPGGRVAAAYITTWRQQRDHLRLCCEQSSLVNVNTPSSFQCCQRLQRGSWCNKILFFIPHCVYFLPRCNDWCFFICIFLYFFINQWLRFEWVDGATCWKVSV